jgi:hypothetical protein
MNTQILKSYLYMASIPTIKYARNLLTVDKLDIQYDEIANRLLTLIGKENDLVFDNGYDQCEQDLEKKGETTNLTRQQIVEL